MKILKPIIIFTCVILLNIGLFAADYGQPLLAQWADSSDTFQDIEYKENLRALKSSAQDTINRNKELLSQNQRLKIKISALRKEFEGLDDQKNQLLMAAEQLSERAQQESARYRTKQGQGNIHEENIKKFSDANNRLKEEIVGADEEYRLLRHEVAVLEQELPGIDQASRQVQAKAKQSYSDELRSYKKTLNENEQRQRIADKELAGLAVSCGILNEKKEQLSGHISQLTGRLASLTTGKDEAAEGEPKVKELTRLEQQGIELKKLKGETESLRRRHAQLLNFLKSLREKYTQQLLSPVQYSAEEKYLKESIVVLKEENNFLRREIADYETPLIDPKLMEQELRALQSIDNKEVKVKAEPITLDNLE